MENYVDKVFKLLFDIPLNEWWELENNVSPQNREKFLDVVKLFIEFDYGFFAGFRIELGEMKLKKASVINSGTDIKPFFTQGAGEKENPYREEIENLKNFFATATLPETFQIDSISKVTDVPKFVASHLEYLSGDWKIYKQPYKDRLNDLMGFILAGA